jgi:hypothetical protein
VDIDLVQILEYVEAGLAGFALLSIAAGAIVRATPWQWDDLALSRALRIAAAIAPGVAAAKQAAQAHQVPADKQ